MNKRPTTQSTSKQFKLVLILSLKLSTSHGLQELEEVQVVEVILAVLFGTANIVVDLGVAQVECALQGLNCWDQARVVSLETAILESLEVGINGGNFNLSELIRWEGSVDSLELIFDKEIHATWEDLGETVLHGDKRVDVCGAIDVCEEISEAGLFVDVFREVLDL